MQSQRKKQSGNAPARSHVAVAIRVRPSNEKETKERDTVVVKTDSNDRSVTVRTKTFSNFERVYGVNTKQSDIYKDLVKKQVEDVLRGYNCTIFAYGQTGTGKTYTMEGGEGSIEGDWETDETTGIIPRAAQHIFAELNAKEGIEYVVRLSYVEIYNEEMIDLLASPNGDNKHLRLYEDTTKKGSIVIHGVEDIPVRCRDDVYRLLKQGTELRRTAETLMNKSSSRSHSVLTISVLVRECLPTGEELVKQGKLRLVDLAGSENIGRSGAEGKRAKEAGNINTSLLALGRVINALTSNAPHVPYRESKLTRLLQDSLGGTAITTIIATLSPVNSNFEESISTLEYAHRAMNIKNKPEVNENLNKKDLFKEYSGQIERLMRELKAARDKNGVFLEQEMYDEMGQKIETYEEKIGLLEQQLEDTIELMKKHLADIELMDDLYGKAYMRVRTLEERLAVRVEELEEAKMTIAKEEAAHEETRRALERSRAHSDLAFTVAEETKRQGWEAGMELMGLHARCDAIGEIARDNRGVSMELSQSISSSVPPMIESHKERMKKGEEEVEKTEKTLDAFHDVVTRQIPVAKTGSHNATENMKSLLSGLASLEVASAERVEKETNTLVEMIQRGQLSVSATIHSVVALLVETAGEAKKRVEEMEKRNEEMRKEMEQLRADCRETLSTAQRKRVEAAGEMEKKRKEMSDMMASLLASMADLGDSTEADQRAAEDTIAQRINTMGETEKGWGDKTEESCFGLKKLMKESSENAKEEISSALPTLSSMGEKTVEYNEKSAEERRKTKEEMEQIKSQTLSNHSHNLESILAAADSIQESHQETRHETQVTLEKMKSLLSESSNEVTGNIVKLEKIVVEETEKIREIPDKEVAQVYREWSDNPCPPTEEELYGEEEEEVEVEGEDEGANDENDTAASRFKNAAKLRRSRFRVRDSILQSGEQLHSPSKLIGMRGQKIEEEGSEASFGSDRTNRRVE